MIKYVGLGLVIWGCTAMGMSAGNEMAGRIRDIRELLKFLELLEGEIGYANAVLTEGFRHAARRMGKPYASFLKNMAEHMDELRGDMLGEIFEQHVREDLRHTALLPADKEGLVCFGEQLGNLDVKMQLAAIALYKEQLTQTCTQAQERYQRDSKMYRCLGLMGGLFLAVVFL